MSARSPKTPTKGGNPKGFSKTQSTLSAAASEDEPPRRPPLLHLFYDEQRVSGADVAGLILRDIVEAAVDSVNSRKLDERGLFYEVEHAFEQMASVLDMYFVGCEDTTLELGSSSWLPDEEPVPSPPDHWSRNAVGTRSKHPVALIRQDNVTRLSEFGKSDASRSMQRLRCATMFVSASAPTLSRANKPGVPEGTLLAKGQHGRSMEHRPATAGVNTHVFPLKGFDDGIKDRDAVLKKIRARNAADARTLAELEERYAGRSYTMTETGQLLGVAPPSVSSLPPLKTQPRVALFSPDDRPDTGAASTKNGVMLRQTRTITPSASANVLSRSSKQNGGTRGAGHTQSTPTLRPMSRPYLPVPGGEQPAIQETIKVNSGVLLTVEQATSSSPTVKLTGGPRRHQPGRMSKSEYRELQSRSQSRITRVQSASTFRAPPLIITPPAPRAAW
uniref:Uncharacterized protein n=1 Tax=Chrysotila carterae TaxID=13221 RepID=A0A7S4B563_CHRCT